jgi:hypothetical protein
VRYLYHPPAAQRRNSTNRFNHGEAGSPAEPPTVWASRDVHQASRHTSRKGWRAGSPDSTAASCMWLSGAPKSMPHQDRTTQSGVPRGLRLPPASVLGAEESITGRRAHLQNHPPSGLLAMYTKPRLRPGGTQVVRGGGRGHQTAPLRRACDSAALLRACHIKIAQHRAGYREVCAYRPRLS